MKSYKWKQSAKSIEIGDEIFIYVGSPISAIKYKCTVNKINLTTRKIDDSKFVLNGEPYNNYMNYMELELLEKYDNHQYAFEVLKETGLKGSIQGPRRANGLIVFIVAALIYFVSPIDIIPDGIPVLGFLDDAIVAGIVVKWCKDDINKYMAWLEDKQKA